MEWTQTIAIIGAIIGATGLMIAVMKIGLNTIDKRFDNLERRFGNLEQRMDRHLENHP